MHIPDGFLDPLTALITYMLSITYAIYAFYRVRRSKKSEEIVLASVLAAGIFAAQMLNWPLPGGTSLHFVGGALAGILLGPWLGFISVFLVLLVQCLVFHDGGITALGANVFNMAILDVLAGYIFYKLFPEKYKLLGAFLGGWLGITIAGIACGVELGFSGQFPYSLQSTVLVMGTWHALLGLIEGTITSAVVSYIIKKAPHLLMG